MRFINWLRCWWGHDWTCKALQGIKPRGETFREFATMYCARCGKVSELHA